MACHRTRFPACCGGGGVQRSCPLSVGYFIETVLPTRNAAAFRALLNVVAGALTATLAAGFARDFLFARLRSRSLAGVRRSMFRRLQNLSMQFHAALDRHQMLERFSSDLATVENAFSLRFPGALCRLPPPCLQRA